MYMVWFVTFSYCSIRGSQTEAGINPTLRRTILLVCGVQINDTLELHHCMYFLSSPGVVLPLQKALGVLLCFNRPVLLLSIIQICAKLSKVTTERAIVNNMMRGYILILRRALICQAFGKVHKTSRCCVLLQPFNIAGCYGVKILSRLSLTFRILTKILASPPSPIPFIECRFWHL